MTTPKRCDVCGNVIEVGFGAIILFGDWRRTYSEDDAEHTATGDEFDLCEHCAQVEHTFLRAVQEAFAAIRNRKYIPKTE